MVNVNGCDGKTVVIVRGRTSLGQAEFACRVPNIDVESRVLFIAGCLDDAAVWSGVFAALDHNADAEGTA